MPRTKLRASALWVTVQYRLAGTEKHDLERCWQLSALLIGVEIHTEASSLAAAADLGWQQSLLLVSAGWLYNMISFNHASAGCVYMVALRSLQRPAAKTRKQLRNLRLDLTFFDALFLKKSWSCRSKKLYTVYRRHFVSMLWVSGRITCCDVCAARRKVHCNF